MSRITDSERIEILFNKSFGVATTVPGGLITQMPTVNANDKIIPALQVFSQYIPPVAPDELDLEDDPTFNSAGKLTTPPPGTVHPFTGELPVCRRRRSRTYPWIVKYENLPLTAEVPKKSFNAYYDNDGTVPMTNLLSNAIPFNYDPGQSYAILVFAYYSAIPGWWYFASDDNDLSWNYDSAAGFMTFYGDKTNLILGGPYEDIAWQNDIPPIVTFWRYEGEFGLSSTNEGGAGATGEKGDMGEVGPTGYTGEKGEKGDASLTGATGDMGPTGYTGAKGEKGDASLTGAAGDIGPTGYTGDKGEIGYTGEKGDMGEVGPTGASGEIGATGANGEKGEIGATGEKGEIGASGEIGATGASGEIGATGEKGEIGEKGETGDMGPTGYTGAKGEKGDASLTGAAGDIGPTGYTGDKGEIGYTGEKGDMGEVGPTGASGEIGATGASGEIGATGEKGEIGASGEIGATGAYGEIGATGEKGEIGEKGETGDMGPTGYTGAKGEKGDASLTGAAGDIGPTGYTGDKGEIGYTGEKGDMGEAGPTGASGEIGATGANGEKGEIGATGEKGEIGASGEIGATGASGEIGATGASGEIGEKGETGDMGPTGYTGAKGEKGDASLTGATGDIGPTGYTGAKGDSGETANTGATGAIGPTGPAGSGGGGGGGTYANDTWMLDNLFGQPPPIQFGTPVSKSNTIYIPWSYPTQKRSGWVVNQWLPSITNFTASITPGTGAPGTVSIPTDTTNKWINDNTGTKYVTLLAIQKTSMTSSFADVTYTDSNGTSYTAYAYQYYEPTLVSKLGNQTTVNKITSYYSNPSTFTTDPNNSVEQIFYGFVASGAPSAPRNVTPTITAGGNSINLAWTAPQYADIVNTSEGTISSYDISYNTIGSAIRYGGPISQIGGANSVTGLSTVLSSLYPDASYSIVVLATNNSSLKGAYSDVVTGYSNSLPAPDTLSTISLNSADSYSTSIFKVAGQVSISPVPLIKVSTPITTPAFICPIHKQANRGSTGTQLMTLSSTLNAAAGPSVQYSGFPATAPAAASSNNVTMTTTSVVDYYTSTTPQGGFYLKSTNTITINPAGFIKRSSTPNTLTVQQTFSDSSTSSIATVNFYYDTPIATAPSGSINAVNILPSYFAKVSGLSILHGAPIITIDASANNMGSYFYASPLITYTCTNGANTGTKQETNLAAVKASDITGDTFTNGNLSFYSSYTSSSLASIYSKTIVVNASANNVNSSGTLTGRTINVITDGPSRALAYLVTGVPTLVANTLAPGFRILSDATVNNNCSNVPTTPTSYDNNSLLTASPYTTELLISNGLFVTTASAYENYSSYMGNTVNYSTITRGAGDYRFVSFCWKLPANASAYTKLSFTIDSITSATLTGAKLLLINGVQIPIFYAFRDTAATTPSETTFISGWINANSNNNPVGSGNFYRDENKYGNLGGLTSDAVTLTNGNTTATINVFIPTINPVVATVNLYLRIAVPMNVDIRFGKVSARVGN